MTEKTTIRFDAESIEKILSELKADKNGHIRGTGRVIDKIQSLHLQSIEAEKQNECHCGGYPDCICNLPEKTAVEQARDDYYNRDKLFERKQVKGK